MLDFNVKYLSSETYSLDIVKSGHTLTSFVFTPLCHNSPSKSVVAIDLYCLNTSSQHRNVSSSQLSELSCGASKAHQLFEELSRFHDEVQSVLVIDIHHHEKRYSHPLDQAEEMLVSELLDFPDKETWRRGRLPFHKAGELLMETKSLALLFEGSLKHDILKHSGLSVEDQQALQSDGALLCQIAEVFMNAFKFGHQGCSLATGKKFDGSVYYTSKKGACQKSYVLYSAQYQQLYGIDSSFVNKMRAVFQVALVEFDPKSSITTLCYAYQGGV